jgi:hypothetical protein
MPFPENAAKYAVVTLVAASFGLALAQSGSVFRCPGNKYENTADPAQAAKLTKSGCKPIGGESRLSITGETRPTPVAETRRPAPAAPVTLAEPNVPARTTASAPWCTAHLALNLRSSGYSGPIDIELRTGSRPGSRLVGKFQLETGGTWNISDLCPGSYFFAFATLSSEDVSTTQDYEVNPFAPKEVLVTYTRYPAGGHRVGKEKRTGL